MNEFGMLRKALGVEEFPESFDPNKTPETGEEFLHYVMFESMQCEDFTTSKRDFKKFRTRQTTYTQVTPCEQVPKRCVFSEEWQNSQVADFSAFRNHVQKMLISFKPDPDYKFDGNIGPLHTLCGTPPKTYNLLNLNQKNITRLLHFYVKLLEQDEAKLGLPYSFNVWLYGLFSCVAIPIWPDNSSLLRKIGRNICKILAGLPQDISPDILTPLNLFLFIIVKYFNNNDLIDIQ